MRVKVVRAFYDAQNKNKFRMPGTIYETSQKRASDLEKGKFVLILDEKVEMPTGEPKEMEKKVEVRKKTTKKKTTKK